MVVNSENTKDRLLVQIATYNTNLQGIRGVPQDLVDWLSPTLQVSTFLAPNPRAPDIIAVGFQELLPLHVGMVGLTKGVLAHRDALIRSELEKHTPNKERYTLAAKVVNVGVALLVYARDDTVGRALTDVESAWTSCGGAYMGNKGAVGVRFRAAGEVHTFVCAHLAAHEHLNARRVSDWNHIVRTLLFRPIKGSGSTSTLYDTSHLFVFGDLNFRLALPRTHPHRVAVRQGAFAAVLEEYGERVKLREFDQLEQERKRGSAFVGLREGEYWKFKCSYKYHIGEVDKYSTLRTPSWTDRVLYTTHTDSPDTPENSNIINLVYTSIPSYTTSDHKPVVTLLMLPPSQAGTTTTPPVLRLPEGFSATPDPRATLKRCVGLVMDRAVGSLLYLLTIVGIGSPLLGIGNLILGLGAWTWWMIRW